MFFRCHVLWVAFAVAVCLGLARRGEANEELYHKVALATAVVYKSPAPPGGGSGTGFLIDAQERLLVTARHVVENINGGMPAAVYVIFAQSRDGDIITEASFYRKHWNALAIKGKVVYENVRRDMAVVQLEKVPSGVKPLELATKRARPGQIVHLVGNSGEGFGAVFNYCQGHVRNAFYWEEMGARVVATQAPTNRGDSGGPMVNSLGQVVGFAAMSTTGNPQPKTSTFHEVQVTEFSICVTEMRAALKEMRDRLLAKQDNPTSQKTLLFQGTAKPAAHAVHLDKDVMYRIMVKAENFVPEIRIDSILAPIISSAPGPNYELQHLFVPAETKEYRIQVASVPGRDLGAGPAKYSFTVDQVAFEPETAIKGAELKLNEHVRKFEAGKAYDIAVKGKGFEPDVAIADGTKTVLMQFNFGRKTGGVQALFEAVGLTGAEFETTLRFVAPKTQDYRILIAVSPYSPAATAPLQYSVAITEQKVVLSAEGQLTAKDPIHRRAGPFKAHAVKLEAGKNYQIDLATTAFDSHLLLEDAAGKVVAQGFDVDEFGSRLVFRPAKTDTYRVIASAHQVDARGAYTVTAAENPSAQPGLPRLNKKGP